MAAQRRHNRRETRDLATLIVAVSLAVASLISIVRLSRPVQEKPAETGQVQLKGTQSPGAEPTAESQDAKDAERDDYIATWAERIDAFNAGYPLEGYGATFAAAAWDCGVDPRYSPAIARVESGSGMNCTYSCNAWGWGSSSWPDWDSAIYAHVAGLAEGYGHTLSYEAALSYNELTPDEWYAQVESCMYQIWESE